MTWISSSKRHPCPVCDRTKDGDCRTSEADNVVLCHTHINDPNETLHGYKYLHVSKDGLWGVWIYQQPNSQGKISGRKPPRTGPKRQSFYYHDRSGERLIMVVRVQNDNGKKDFYQHRWTGAEWAKGINDYCREHVPVYRYAEVRKAVADGKAIFVVEGEGKADRLWELGIPATTTIGGSKKYRSYGSYFDDLKDAKLVLCPDRDRTGIEHMEEIFGDFPTAKWCYIFPESPLWKHLPDSNGLDIADWIASGTSATDILAAVTDKRTSEEKAKKQSISKPDLIARVAKLETIDSLVEQVFEMADLTKLSGWSDRRIAELRLALKTENITNSEDWLMNVEDFSDQPMASDEWIFNGFLKAGGICLLAAESKVGKSLLLYDWMYEIGAGGMWGEFSTSQPRPIVIVQTDEAAPECQERIKARGLHELKNAKIITQFTPQLLPRLKKVLQDIGPGGVVMLDSLTSINRFSGFSPKDPEYAYFLYDLQDMLGTVGWSAIVVTHTNKSPLDANGQRGVEKIAGSFAIAAAVSDILMIERVPGSPRDDKQRLLHRLGGRRGAPKSWKMELNLEDYSWEWIGECDARGDERTEGEDTKLRAHARSQVLAWLQDNAGTGYTAQEISYHINRAEDRIRLLCGEMFREGLICRRSGNTRAKVYYLPEVVAPPGSDRGSDPRSDQESPSDAGFETNRSRSDKKEIFSEQIPQDHIVQTNQTTPETIDAENVQPLASTKQPGENSENSEKTGNLTDRDRLTPQTQSNQEKLSDRPADRPTDRPSRSPKIHEGDRLNSEGDRFIGGFENGSTDPNRKGEIW